MTADEAKEAKVLVVAITEDGKEVLINQPAREVDAEGWSHVVFSPDQAVHLAVLLFRKANIIRGIVCGHCGDAITQEGGWATARFRYCFKQECQQVFYQEAQDMVRKVDPEVADRLAEATSPQTFTCPKCSAVSHNPGDILNRYCGACHEFAR